MSEHAPRSRLRATTRSAGLPAVARDAAFAEVLSLIQQARQRSYQAVNTELVDLYWRVGEYVSCKLASAEWGDGVVADLARYLARSQPGLRGFSRQNLFRMRQFYETYRHDPVVSALLRQLPWTHHLIMLSQSKRADERAFYMRLAARERWSSRELERQLQAALFERATLNPPAASAQLSHTHPEALDAFKDSYVVEFLDLPESHSEADLHRGLLRSLKDFIIELGRDFCFVGSETPIQVGGRDFSLDLLFFHRGLNCLVAIELKAGHSSRSTWESSSSIWRPWTATCGSPTKARRSVSCCAPPGTARSSSTPSHARPHRRSSPSTSGCSRTRSSCAPSSTSSIASSSKGRPMMTAECPMVEVAPRIAVDEAVRFGRAVIAGTRVPVETVVGRLADGMSVHEVAEEYGVGSPARS